MCHHHDSCKAGWAVPPSGKHTDRRGRHYRHPRPRSRCDRRHDAVDVIRTRVVLDEPSQKIPVVRIVDAQRLRIATVEILLLQLFDIRQVFAKNILEPADDFHSALLRCRNYFSQDVEVPMAGCARKVESHSLSARKLSERVNLGSRRSSLEILMGPS